MTANPKKTKISTRRKKTEAPVPGIHSLPKEVVEIERNLIESWLMSLKQWFQLNIQTARKIILGVVVVTVVFIISIFIHSAVIEKQNSDFYRIIISYDNIKKAKNDTKNYNDKIKNLKESADKLCNARWSTQYSNAGCLISALLNHETGNFPQAAENLEKFSQDSNNLGFSAYASLISGFLFEKTEQNDKSLKLYQKLLSKLDDKTSKDIALYHYGRLLYHNKQYPEAEKSFQEIIDNHKNSMFLQKAKQYLLLIAVSKT